MNRFHSNLFIRTIIVILLMIAPLITAVGQITNSADTKKVYFKSRVQLIDSLTNQVDQLINEKQRSQDKIRKLEEINRTKEIELKRLKTETIKLKRNLEKSIDENLQLTHTSYVLFIFNILLAVILLIALLWMYMRKKEATTKNIKTQKVIGNNDTKIDLIQKLGSLRDKGLLTDEEFNFQKRQLIGHKSE